MSEEPNYKTTDKDFAEFERLVRAFIVFFGLYDWEIRFRHEKCEDAMATCGWVTGIGKLATFTLSTEWESQPVTPQEMRRVAFHETLELLMADAWNIAIADDLTDAVREMQLDREHHRIIRRMENCVLPYLP